MDQERFSTLAQHKFELSADPFLTWSDWTWRENRCDLRVFREDMTQRLLGNPSDDAGDGTIDPCNKTCRSLLFFHLPQVQRAILDGQITEFGLIITPEMLI